MTKILVVDDETDLEILIKQKFRRKIREGEYEFVFAINGKHALDQLQKHTDVDVVLSDINMPEMDGLEATRQIRDSDSSRINNMIPIIAMTAHAMKGDKEKFLNAGMNDYISKPIDIEEFLGVIKKYSL